MKDEYIIINSTALQKRIEELEGDYDNGTLTELKRLLSQSTPLIPEIEKAYFEGECYGIGTDACTTKQDYITNLKLDI